jgi:hypothetical protein
MIVNVWPPPSPERNHVFYCFAQTKFIESDRTQPAEHAPHLPLHRTNGVGDRLNMMSRFGHAAFLQHARSGCSVDC